MSLLIRYYDGTSLGSAGESMLMLAEPAMAKEVVALDAIAAHPSDGSRWCQMQPSVDCHVVFDPVPSPAMKAVSVKLPAGVVYTAYVRAGCKIMPVTP